MRKMLTLAAVLSAFALAAPAASAAGMSGRYCLKGPGAQMNCKFETMAACIDNKQDTQTCIARQASTTGSGTYRSNRYCLKGPGAQIDCKFETMAACNDHKQDTQTCIAR